MELQNIVIKVCLALSTVVLISAMSFFLLPSSKKNAERTEKLALFIAEAETNYAAKNGKYYFFPPKNNQAIEELGLSASLLQDFMVEVDHNRNNNIVVRIFPKGSAMLSGSVKPALYEYDLKNKSGQWLPITMGN